MAKITLPNGQVKDDQRKIGNGRLKLAVGDWIKIILVIISFVWGYAILTATVNNNSKVLANQDKEINETTIRSRTNETNIIGLKEDVKEIKQDVKSILKLVK